MPRAAAPVALLLLLTAGCLSPALTTTPTHAPEPPWRAADEQPAPEVDLRVLVLPSSDPHVGLNFSRYAGMPEVWFRALLGPDGCHSPTYRAHNSTVWRGPRGYRLVSRVEVLPPAPYCSPGEPDHLLFELLEMPIGPVAADVWATRNGTTTWFHGAWVG